jgi:hypothetical protein
VLGEARRARSSPRIAANDVVEVPLAVAVAPHWVHAAQSARGGRAVAASSCPRPQPTAGSSAPPCTSSLPTISTVIVCNECDTGRPRSSRR